MESINTIDNKSWLISSDDKDDYYLNDFLLFSVCKSSLHIIKVNIFNDESIKYKCKCGVYKKRLEEVFQSNTFQMQKSEHFNNNYNF